MRRIRTLRLAALFGLAWSLCLAIPAAAQQPVVVRLWNWNIHDKKYQQKMYKLFNQEHPDIKIEYSSISNTVYNQTLEAAFIAQEPPDLFLPSGKYDFPYLRSKGLIMPLNEMAPTEKELADWMALYPSVLKRFVEGVTLFDGKVYTVNLEGETAGIMPLYYNKALFKEVGLSKPPLTQKELRDFAAKITQAGAGKYFGISHGLRYGGVWGNDVARSMAPAAGVISDSIGDGPDLKTGTYRHGDPEFVKAFQVWIDMRKDGSVFPGDATMDDEQAKMAFATNKAGLIFGGPWVVGNTLAYNPEADFDLTLPPRANDGVFRGYAWASPTTSAFGYVVAKTTKNPKAVWEVIKFLCSEEYQSGYVRGGFGVSFLAEANKPENFQIPQLARFVEWLPLKRIAPWTPLLELRPYIKGIYPDNVDVMTNVYLGASGIDAMKDLEKRMEAGFDQAIKDANAAGLKISRKDFYFPDWDPSKDYVSGARK